MHTNIYWYQYSMAGKFVLESLDRLSIIMHVLAHFIRGIIGGYAKHSLHVGKLHCVVSSRIVDDRRGYLLRDGKSHDLAKMRFDGEGFTISTHRYRTNTWGMRIDSIHFPTLRDTLWAVHTLVMDHGVIRELYLGYDCHVPLRVSRSYMSQNTNKFGGVGVIVSQILDYVIERQPREFSQKRRSFFFLFSFILPLRPRLFFVRQIHLWGSRLLTFRFTLPIRGEYGLHIPKGVDDDDDVIARTTMQQVATASQRHPAPPGIPGAHTAPAAGASQNCWAGGCPH